MALYPHSALGMQFVGGASGAASFQAFKADVNGVIRSLLKGKGTTTFARSSTATVTDHEGLVKGVLANELRFVNARRVENLLEETDLQDIGDGSTLLFWDSTGDLAFTYGQTDPDGGTDAVLIDLGVISDNEVLYNRNGGAGYVFEDGHTYVFSVWLKSNTGSSGTWTINYYDGSHNRTDITVTTSWQRFVLSFSPSAASPGYVYILDARSANVTLDEVLAYGPQLEDVTGQTNQNPSEYVSVGVLAEADYKKFSNVDGVRYYAHENGNTVDGNGVVTEAKGAAITDWYALFEPAATNYTDTDDDLTGGAETVDLTAGGTGDYTLSVVGTAAVTVAAGTATGTGFGQATEGSDVTFNLTGAGTVTLTLDSGTLDASPAGDYLKQVEKGSLASSFIPSAGAGATTRTADDGTPMFDYGNFTQAGGTLVFDLAMAEAVNQGIFSVANAEAGVISYDTVNEFQTDDGTNQANVDPTLASNLNDKIRFAVDWSTDDDTLFIGYKNVTDAGSWVWDTDSAAYDDTFANNSVINIFYDIAAPSKVKDLRLYSSNKGKTWIEDNY